MAAALALLASACALTPDDASSDSADLKETEGTLVPETAPAETIVVGNADNYEGLTRLHYGLLQGLLDDPALKDVKVVFVGSKDVVQDEETVRPKRDGQKLRDETISFSTVFKNEFSSGRFSVSGVATDSNWVRDYFPLSVKKDSDRHGVKFRYVHPMAPSNGIAGTKTAQKLGMRVVESDLALEGGNIMIDDAQTLFTTTKVIEANKPKSKTEIETELRRVLGARDIVWLDPLPGEATGHVDIVAKVVGPKKVIVGSSDYKCYAPGKCSPRQPALDANAEKFRARGYTVVRMMNAEADGDYRPLTYTNSLLVNGTAFVPTYFDPARVANLDDVASYADAVNACEKELPLSEGRSTETERMTMQRTRGLCVLKRVLAKTKKGDIGPSFEGMLKIYERDEAAKKAYEGLGLRVVQVPALKMIEQGGSIHCLTMQIAR